jgi:hypothetical protein
MIPKQETQQTQGSGLGGIYAQGATKVQSDEEAQYNTGWWNYLSGGHKEKESAIAMANIDRNFQERMSSSAYQRATQDMIKAGLNPALAYTQGGASTPSGSKPNVPQSNTGQMVGVLLQALGMGAKIATSAIKASTIAKAGTGIPSVNATFVPTYRTSASKNALPFTQQLMLPYSQKQIGYSQQRLPLKKVLELQAPKPLPRASKRRYREDATDHWNEERKDFQRQWYYK